MTRLLHLIGTCAVKKGLRKQGIPCFSLDAKPFLCCSYAVQERKKTFDPLLSFFSYFFLPEGEEEERTHFWRKKRKEKSCCVRRVAVKRKGRKNGKFLVFLCSFFDHVGFLFQHRSYMIQFFFAAEIDVLLLLRSSIERFSVFLFEIKTKERKITFQQNHPSYLPHPPHTPHLKGRKVWYQH